MLIFGYWVKTIPAGCRFAAPASNEVIDNFVKYGILMSCTTLLQSLRFAHAKKQKWK